jgi:hypothetical protein
VDCRTLTKAHANASWLAAFAQSGYQDAECQTGGTRTNVTHTSEHVVQVITIRNLFRRCCGATVSRLCPPPTTRWSLLDFHHVFLEFSCAGSDGILLYTRVVWG